MVIFNSNLLGITGLTKENFSIFIGHSSKRINLTQVLLVDILACDQSKITSDYIKHIVALGQVIELKAVSIRDVHKAELNDNSNYNCYYNWLKTRKLYFNNLSRRQGCPKDEREKQSRVPPIHRPAQRRKDHC